MELLWSCYGAVIVTTKVPIIPDAALAIAVTVTVPAAVGVNSPVFGSISAAPVSGTMLPLPYRCLCTHRLLLSL